MILKMFLINVCVNFAMFSDSFGLIMKKVAR